MDSDGLNIRQRKFVNAYLENGGNASKAYKDAGYECSNRNVLDVNSCTLLRSPKIQTVMHKRQEEAVKSSEISLDRKRNALWDIAKDGMNKSTGTEAPVEIMNDSRASIAAISELNRMDGHHAATNSNINIQAVSFIQDIGIANNHEQQEKTVEGEILDK